jgi:hypothetical protein
VRLHAVTALGVLGPFDVNDCAYTNRLIFIPLGSTPADSTPPMHTSRW